MKTIFAVGFTALLVSCSTTKEATSSAATQNRGRSNQEAVSNPSSRTATTSKTAERSRTASTDASSVAATNRMSEAEGKMDFKRMYNDLNMTPDQIGRFENKWEKTTDSWKSNNRNKVMNNYERIEFQDRILRDILDDAQFEAYQVWVRDNSGRK